MKFKLAIVVLTWRDWKNTIKCLESIYQQKYKYFKVFVIDNNSQDNTFEKIKKWSNNKIKINDLLVRHKNKKITLYDLRNNQKLNNDNLSKHKYFFLENEKNLGCGYGHNTGYEIAIKFNFKYVARIDNDMIMPKNFFSNIISKIDNKENIQAISPKIMYKFEKNKIWWRGTTIGNNLKIQRHLRNYPYGEKDNKKLKGLIETDAIAGCASIMRVKRLKKIGLSDPDFFYGPEDIEFSRRIYDKKGSLRVDLDTKIFHAVTQSFKNLSKRRMYFEYKYRLLLIKKIGTFYDKLFGYSVSIIKWFIYLILFINPKHRIKISPVGKAILDFFLGKLGNFDRKRLN